ncbi:hypothetical protein K466DRAFT_598915 [Polyporus arcularius HHB13444]|uniref:Uncharacterized protein n=1 Tax=Polyporus arcularius HHB13444 TaxID=1314778 RepID=A0A5C3PGH1_9APHY|nr:hypothetical protein K466DRAFT_598915 [Polyporus arcularius HHB13444]
MLSPDVPGPLYIHSYAQGVEQDLLNSRIVALVLESMLYGVFTLTYCIGVGELLRGNQPNRLLKRNRMLLVVNTVMFGLATTHFVLTTKITMNGFVAIGARGADRKSVYDTFSRSTHFGSTADIAQFYIYVTQTLIGDVFMVCRLFVVWNDKRAVVALPVILILIDTVSGYGCVPLGRYGILVLPLVFFSFSFFTNMFCTVLIMWRLLQADKVLHADWRFRSRAWFNIVQYRRIVEAIIQSAAIYSTASIALVMTTFLSPNIGYVACLSVFPQIIGVVFSLIVIQIARKSALSNLVNNQSPEWQDMRVVGAAINTKGHTRAMDLEMQMASGMTGAHGEGTLRAEREAARYDPSAELAATEDVS